MWLFFFSENGYSRVLLIMLSLRYMDGSENHPNSQLTTSVPDFTRRKCQVKTTIDCTSRAVPALVWVIGPLISGTGQRFRSFWSAFRWFMAYSVLFSFLVRPVSPAREPGAISVKLATPTGAQDRLTFGANLPLFRRHFAAPRLPREWCGDSFRGRFLPAP